MDEENYKIRVYFQEAFTFQKCIKMNSESFSNCNLYFTEDGMYILASNKDETLSMEFEINVSKLLKYEYKYGVEVCNVTVPFQELSRLLNNIKKKDSLVLTVTSEEKFIVSPIINGTSSDHNLKICSEIEYNHPDFSNLNFTKITSKDVSHKLGSILQKFKKTNKESYIRFKAIGPSGFKIITYDENNVIDTMVPFGDLSINFRNSKNLIDVPCTILSSYVIWKDVYLQGAITKISLDPGHGIQISQDCGLYGDFTLRICKEKNTH